MDLSVDKAAIKPAIYEHPEFAAFIRGMQAHFAAWRNQSAAALMALQAGCHPKEVIARLSEDLLAHYQDKPLIDPYDIYQHLLDYWAQTMQDDLYLIAADGWKAETSRIVETDKKGRQRDKGWTCDLAPKALIVARYYAREQAAIDQLAAELEGVSARLAELEEEHGGEDGAFAELDKVNRAAVAQRVRELRIENGTQRTDEMDLLAQWLRLDADAADLKKRVKDAEAALDAAAYAHYARLTEAEIQALVVDDKWLAALAAAIHGEMDRVSQQLTQRVKELAERYETPMPRISERVADLQARVNGHLDRMGFQP